MQRDLIGILLLIAFFLACKNDHTMFDDELVLDIKIPNYINYSDSIYLRTKYNDEVVRYIERDSIVLNDFSWTELPASFYQYLELKFIRINCTNSTCLKSIPNRIKNMNQLEIIELANTSIDTLPLGLFQLKKLKELKVYGGKLKYIPNQIDNLENLEVLDLCANQLNELPNSIYRLKKLNYLNIAQNQLSDREIEDLQLNLPNTYIIY